MLDELGAECRDLILEPALLDRLDRELRDAGFRATRSRPSSSFSPVTRRCSRSAAAQSWSGS